jgi:hypothetical protein
MTNPRVANASGIRAGLRIQCEIPILGHEQYLALSTLHVRIPSYSAVCDLLEPTGPMKLVPDTCGVYREVR